MEDNSLARIEVGSAHSEGNVQLLKRLALQCALEKGNHAVVGRETAARKGPAGKGRETGIACNLFHLGDRQAAAIAGANQRSHACAGHGMNWNVFFFEDFQDADVSDAASETSAQRKADGLI